jgi:hypothetical protein
MFERSRPFFTGTPIAAQRGPGISSGQFVKEASKMLTTKWWTMVGGGALVFGAVGCAGTNGGCINGKQVTCSAGMMICSPPSSCPDGKGMDTGRCCGDEQPPQSALTSTVAPAILASWPPDSQRILIDPSQSQATLTVQGSAPVSASASGVLNLRIDDTHSELDRFDVGFTSFSLNGAAYRSAHLLNNGIVPVSTGDGLFFVAQADADLLADALVDNVHTHGVFTSPQDLLGNYDGVNWMLSGTFSDATRSLSFSIAGTAQPTGTDTDHDGVPDVTDNCPAIANPSQSRVIAPTLLAPPAVTLTHCSASEAALIGQPQVVDNCGAAPVTVMNDAPAVFPLGTTVVTWTASDGAGNVNKTTQLVTVELGDDPSCCPAGSHVIIGTSNNDTLVGTPGPDCILGLGGQDHISGGGGNDVISGGDGDDVISGDDGDDIISGGTGQDHITGGAGNDTIFGDDGDDVCSGGDGNDTLIGGAGQDQLSGDSGNDTLIGGIGDDRLDGGAGSDVCTATSGHDTYLNCEVRN